MGSLLFVGLFCTQRCTKDVAVQSLSCTMDFDSKPEKWGYPRAHSRHFCTML